MSTAANARMTVFRRDDGREIRVVPGFRERALGYRPAVTPKPAWTDEDYAAAAEKKRRRFDPLLAAVSRWRPDLTGADVLDVGCGDGVNCLLMGLRTAVGRVVGIDLYLPLLDAGSQSEPARRLADAVVRDAGTTVGGTTRAFPGASEALRTCR